VAPLRDTQRGGVGAMVFSVCERVASALSVGHMAPRGTKPDGDGRGEKDAGICKREDGRSTRTCAHGVIRACTHASN